MGEYEEKVRKEIREKGKVVSSKLINITFGYDEDGNVLKTDKNNGSSIKINKPKYVDIFNRINFLENEKKKVKNILIKSREEILSGSQNEEITRNFYEYKEKYSKIT